MTHPILRRLSSDEASERRQACLDAAEDPSAVLLVDALVLALGDRERAVVAAAADSLARLGRDHEDVTAALRGALHDADRVRRRGAALVCARLAPPEPRLLPALVDALGAEEGDVRWAATRILVDMGRLHGEVRAVLLSLARDDASPLVRRMAVHGLRALAPDDPATAETLEAATRDPDLRVRRASFAALAALLDPPARVIERLEEALRGDPDPASRRIATVALGALGTARGSLPDSARTALEEARDIAPDPDLRRGAARALEQLGRSGGS